jgi:hypothetical protein
MQIAPTLHCESGESEIAEFPKSYAPLSSSFSAPVSLVCGLSKKFQHQATKQCGKQSHLLLDDQSTYVINASASAFTCWLVNMRLLQKGDAPNFAFLYDLFLGIPLLILGHVHFIDFYHITESEMLVKLTSHYLAEKCPALK